MPEVIRTPDEKFKDLALYLFEPNWFDWNGIRMHYVDEGPKDAPVMLCMHGMPTWSYLYRRMIPSLVDAGYRCIAPDHIGFGKSDKVIDDDWYTIELHSRSITDLIQHLDLTDITVFVQDWGGPIGLRQAVDMPERFSRLVIMNTWLHHAEYRYMQALINWNHMWQPGNMLAENQITGQVLQMYYTNQVGLDEVDEEIVKAYDAPFDGDASKAGPRQFPRSLPFARPDRGNAVIQALCFDALKKWIKPVHFIWGCKDEVFTTEWGRQWASTFPQATFDEIEGAGHFLQESHGEQVVEILLKRIAEE
ncbi:MAG: alpha/beta fold hydrolase [Desulfobacteraceae bacterium]|nr:alpha/beta fold hydrolase [Desulfobacteraceae bacterium]